MTEKFKGIFKLAEECGEVVQVIGKIGPFPSGEHPDGKGDLKTRLEEEIADVLAASQYVVETNGLDAEHVALRSQKKLAQFRDWGLSGILS